MSARNDIIHSVLTGFILDLVKSRPDYGAVLGRAAGGRVIAALGGSTLDYLFAEHASRLCVVGHSLVLLATHAWVPER